MGTPAIIVHGGAGTVEDERRDGCVRGVERAADAGWQILAGGGTALDAVEAATRVLEDDPEFNAGYGGVLNRLGILETDACIMDGELRAGAVGAVPWMRHPISLARHLLESGEHVLLVGGGALLYAREHGFDPDPPESMVSPRAKARHERALAAGREPHDTVGAVAVDAQGRVAAATSTGGTPWKRPGRVGDSPLPGCGNYADDRAGAASATGHGESIIRVVMAKSACDFLRGGAGPDEAARAAVKELVERTKGDGGIIVVDPKGRIGHATSTPRMPWAAVVGGARSSGAEKVTIREARRDELAALSARCADQELLRRYGTTAEKLTDFLTRALDRGDPLLVADEDGTAIGFAWFQASGTFADGGYLRLIALQPGKEGRGHGAALLDEMERRVAARSKNMFLLVSDFNAAARRFYKARGYAEVGSLSGFVLPDVAEVICWKKLR